MSTTLGTDASDSLSGSGGPDEIFGLAGDDWIWGLGGSDTLFGDEGDDTLRGGSGEDFLVGGTGADTLLGGAGLDYASYHLAGSAVHVDLGLGRGLAGEAAGDLLRDIEGLIGTSFADVLIGSEFDDFVYGGYGGDTIYGLAGDDFIVSGQHPNFGPIHELTGVAAKLYGGEGNDTIWASEHSPGDHLFGGAGDDHLYGGGLARGGGGHDFIYAGSGNNQVFGGAGNDTIVATYGDHTVNAGYGNDLVLTEGLHGGHQIIALGGGNDIAHVSWYEKESPKTLDGGGGIDLLTLDFSDGLSARAVLDLSLQGTGEYQKFGAISFRNFEVFEFYLHTYNYDLKLGSGSDTVASGTGQDRLRGAAGNDLLDGGPGADTLIGGRGDDILIPGGSSTSGRDRLFGGAGDDVVFGSYKYADYASHALLVGGTGADVFAFSGIPALGDPYDRIRDFDPTEDHIALHFGPYWEIDPLARAFSQIDYDNLKDTEQRLEFDLIDVGITVRYQKLSGKLSWHGSDDSEVIAIFDGAPDIDMSHFLTIMDVLV